MLSQAIGGSLPAAIAVALSPIPIVAVTVMLGTPRARSNGVSFLCGWIVGLVAVSAAVLTLTHGAGTSGSDASHGVRWGILAIGVLFVLMAIGQWRKRPSHGETPPMPSWMSKVDHFTAPKSAGLGIALSAANPKNLALTAAAAAAIAQQCLSTGGDVVAVAVFVAVGSLSVGGAVLFYVLAPTRATRPLGTVKDFMAVHNAVIMFVVLLILGAKLIGQGVAG